MRGHKICFYGEIWLRIPITRCYLELWFYSIYIVEVQVFGSGNKACCHKVYVNISKGALL